jgi:hypothetical protein
MLDILSEKKGFDLYIAFILSMHELSLNFDS